MKSRLSVRNFDQQNVLNFYSNCEKQTSLSYIQIDSQSQKENECVSLIFQSMVNPKRKTNTLVLYSNPGRAPNFCYEPGVTRK